MTDPPPPSKPEPRRWRRRCRRAFAWAFRLTLFVVVLGFLGGRIFTDNHAWSQWLFWTPAEAWLLAIWLLALATSLLEPRGKGRRWARLGPLVLAAVASLHVALVHWHLENAIFRTPGPTALRVYHWNATEGTDEALHEFLREADPFALRRDAPAVVVLANPPLRLDWTDIVRMLAPEDIDARDIRSHVRRGGRFVFISGKPMSAAGWATLGLQANTTEPDLIDDGTAMFARVELDSGPIVIWGFDWPSDPTRGRMAYVEPSLNAIAESKHTTFQPTTAGPLQRVRHTGFPDAGVVIGDFNTGRGSAAISKLLPDMASAHAQAGIGPDYGWPRFVFNQQRDVNAFPVLALDQAFVQPEAWRATAYRMLDLGSGTHRAQELFITRVGSDPTSRVTQPEAREATN